MAQFGGFGGRGFGIDIGGIQRTWNQMTGNTYEGYASSGELAKDIDNAMKGFAGGDGAGLSQLQAKLARYGRDVKDVLGPHLLMQKQMKDQQEQQRRGGEYNAIMNETQPRPEVEQTRQVPKADVSQFGIGPRVASQMDEMDELSGIEPGTESFYQSGSPGRALNPNDMFRMAGPDVLTDPAKFENIVRLPGQMEADQALAGQRIADASRTKTQGAIEDLKLRELEGLSGSGEPTNRQLALNPSLANRLPQREKDTDPLLEDRRKLLQAQANRANRPPVTAAGGRGGTPLLKEFISMGGDPEDEEAYFEFLQRRSGSTRAPQRQTATPTGDSMEARAAVAQVVDSPQYQQADDATKQQLLNGIAAEFGFKVVGKPARKTKFLGLKDDGTDQKSFSLAPLKSTEGRGGQPNQAGPTPANPAPRPTGKKLDAQTAAAILAEAGGDKDKARAIAKSRGYTF
jgi:hypothetical protein